MAEQWYKLKNNDTGEEQIVASLSGIDEALWQVIPIEGNQAPAEFDVVADNGVVQVDQARKDLSDQVAPLRAMSPDELFAHILGLESRITTLEGKVK